jgi:hypothetical protein
MVKQLPTREKRRYNMSEIEKKYNELYGEFNLTPKDPAYRIFKSGWESASKLQTITDAEIETLLRRVTIEASTVHALYVTESGMKVFARQVEQLLKDKS